MIKSLHLKLQVALIIVLIPFFSIAQNNTKGWHLLDKEKDGYYGISLEKAYKFLKEKNRTSKTVIVAVMDGGVDTAHEDLKNILWHNTKEIANNGKDDDGNGYVDDEYGWNFLGNKNGSDLKKASDEKSRFYHAYKNQFSGKTIDTSTMSIEDKYIYKSWQQANKEVNGDSNDQMEVMMIDATVKALKKHSKIIADEMGKEEFTVAELEKYEPKSSVVKNSKYIFLNAMRLFQVDSDTKNTTILKELDDELQNKKDAIDAKTNAPKNYRAEIIKDDYSNIQDKFYGNKDVMGPDAMHGTHVTGIIAAQRNNGIGINGVADNVKVMELRVVPDGDEYDKDIALGIFYAVDNGAKVINMSFGKYYSPNKRWIDSAFKYAEQKDVLIIHAAGNESNNVDEKPNYPNPFMLMSNYKVNNFINVGASSDLQITPKSIAADFSNYGKQTVDVFAPGVKIYSTLPGGNQYGNLQGTSMASPVVAGIAALIRSYYPTLTAVQVKACIENSVTPISDSVACLLPGQDPKPVPFSSLSKTGGIVNAYRAVMAAEAMVAEKNHSTNHNKKNNNK
ncbi:MAG: S8 family peptidase [Bacteroidetes bacterium]|nr:S8 family peptidase [Bacteroidota bacterium]MBS1650305.1 S8 family peptidase [Bacteroidota bacterium]